MSGWGENGGAGSCVGIAKGGGDDLGQRVWGNEVARVMS